MTSAKEEALALVEEFGWHVFRLRITHNEGACDGGTASCKSIRTMGRGEPGPDGRWTRPGGGWATSDDVSVIAGWDWSNVNGYGIDCGKSGILVVDQDPGAAWPFNGTRIHGTGRGQHFIYEDLIGMRNRVALEPWEVDIRGVGGMVIGPGSWHPHGEYTVEKDSDPTPYPPELMEALRATEKRVILSDEPAGPLDSFLAYDWINELCEQIARTEHGSVNTTLWNLSRLAGGIWIRVPEEEQTGTLDEEHVKAWLLSSVPNDGDVTKSTGTVQRGWEDGLATPYHGTGDYVTSRSPLLDMFDMSPELRHIRQAAKSRGLNPVALLHGVLGRVLGEIPGTVLLPAGKYGSTCALNQVYALVGPPGASKSSTLSVSAEVLGLDPDLTDRPPGSGEGIEEWFMDKVMVPDPVRPDKFIQVRQPKRNERLILKVDEATRLRAVGSRTGNTLMTTVRSACGSGEALGALNATQEKNRYIPSKTYRLLMFLAMQPEHTDVLLNEDEIAAGTPARVVWVDAWDDDRLPSAERPEWPGVLRWHNPFPLGSAEFEEGFTLLEYSEKVNKWVGDWHDARRRDDDPLTAHEVIMRLKQLASLSALHGHRRLADEWWEFSGMLVKDSLQMARICDAGLKETAAKHNKNRGTASGMMKIAEQEVVSADEAAMRRVMTNLMHKVTEDGVTWRTLVNSIAARDRVYVERARARLEADGKIAVTPWQSTKGGRPGEMVRIGNER